MYGSKGTILWFQETPEKITVIDNDGTIREIHRGYGAVTPKAAQYGRLPAGHGEGWLEAMGNPVSYTHLDVYKRQLEYRTKNIPPEYLDKDNHCAKSHQNSYADADDFGQKI